MRSENRGTAGPKHDPAAAPDENSRDQQGRGENGREEFGFLARLFDLRAAHARAGKERPFVTLSYAQSLDGSISREPWRSLRLSSPGSLRLTHYLRSAHDGLLVGINTILADDPQLTVRHWRGPDPRPVILDRALRMPAHARVLGDASRRPIIVGGDSTAAERREELASCGAQVLCSPVGSDGFVDLPATLRLLHEQGIRSVMVEGGGSVITHFLQGRLVDYCVITIAPRFIGGFRAVQEPGPEGTYPCLDDYGCQLLECGYQAVDGDLIVVGAMEAR